MALAFSSGGIGAAFKSRNYAIYWWGTAPDALGAWVYRLASAWLTWELTQSTTWLGLIAFAHMAPVILLCPLAGATADRYGHQRQMICAVLTRAAEVIVLALLVWSDRLTIEILCVLAFVNGTARTFAMPSRQAFVIQLIEPRYISAAVGVNSATFHGANFVGPALAGLIISLSGVEGAFVFVAASGLLAGATVASIRLPPRPGRAPNAPSLFGDLVEGLRYTINHEGIRLVMVAGLVITLFISPYMEMLAAVADRVLGMDATGLSILATASGCGAMCGALWIAWRGRTEGLTRILLVGSTCAAIGMVVFALSTILWLSMTMLFVTGFALVAASSSVSSLVQAAVEPSLRARVMALEAVVHSGAPAVGAVLIGWAGAYFGVQAPLAASAALALSAWVVLARRVWRQSGALEAGPPVRMAAQ